LEEKTEWGLKKDAQRKKREVVLEIIFGEGCAPSRAGLKRTRRSGREAEKKGGPF